jgi:hypothetical protein
VLAATPAVADISQTDLLVAGRAIGFIQKFDKGDVRVAIVYAPNSAESLQEANEIRSLMGTGFRVGDNVLMPFLIRADQAADADARLFFLTHGAPGAAVAGASKARKIPCITFDLAQVRNGSCVIGVQSRPRIQVFVNRKAAEESTTVFSNLFRLMITEY